MDYGDKKQVKESEREAKRRAQDRATLLKSIMSLAAGRRFFNDLLQELGTFSSPFSPDPYVHAFNSGGQNVGLKLLSEITTAAPDEYLLLLKENTDAGRSDADTGGDAE